MTETSLRPTPAVGSPPTELRLDSWPPRDEGLTCWLALAGALGLAALTGYAAESPLLGAAAFAGLAISLWRMWIPIRYQLGPRGLCETVFGRERRVPWTQIAGYEVRRRGVLFHATREPTPLRVFQARYVPWGKKQSELLEIARYYLDR